MVWKKCLIERKALFLLYDVLTNVREEGEREEGESGVERGLDRGVERGVERGRDG